MIFHTFLYKKNNNNNPTEFSNNFVGISGVLSDSVDCSYQAAMVCGEIRDDWQGMIWPDNARELDKACR